MPVAGSGGKVPRRKAAPGRREFPCAIEKAIPRKAEVHA
jgi:hypothetical protein